MDRTCSPGRIAVINPFDGSEVGSVVDMPIDAAHSLLLIAAEGASACRALSRHERARVLDACATLVEKVERFSPT